MLRLPHNPAGTDDDWEGQPAQGLFYQWVLGVAVPLPLIGCGIYAIFTQHAEFGRTGASVTLHGLNAIAFGAAWACAGLFINCHYFWGNVYSGSRIAVLGKIVSACGFIAGLAVVLVRNGVYGLQ